jgi:hypothetical protein
MPIPETKRCPACEIEKSHAEFYSRRKGTGLSSYCKSCTSKQALHRQREFKRLCVEYKGGKCEKCGYDKCMAAFDFHHKDPTQKEIGIARARFTSFNDKIKEELDKCMLLCANCHREEHWNPEDIVFIPATRPKIKKENRCKDCDCQISPKATRCDACFHKTRERISWPSAEVLKKMVEESNYSAVGRQLGVSDQAVRKRLKKYLTL